MGFVVSFAFWNPWNVIGTFLWDSGVINWFFCVQRKTLSVDDLMKIENFEMNFPIRLFFYASESFKRPLNGLWGSKIQNFNASGQFSFHKTVSNVL